MRGEKAAAWFFLASALAGVRMYVCMHAWMYVCLYVCMYVRVYMYVCILYVYIHKLKYV